MAAGFREVFVKELGEGGYTVIEQPGADTLAMDAGRMTLLMELRNGLDRLNARAAESVRAARSSA